ncbi:MAG: LmeA family phospholipid-binding protein [Euzebyales bacterium]|nr:LmeA family phospholipid-binding protein [Euzebyales bacterium]
MTDAERPIPPRDDTQELPLPPRVDQREQPPVPPEDPVPAVAAPPPSRAGRAAGVALAVLGLLVTGVLVANAVITSQAEQRAAERIAREVGASATVSVSHWPAGLRLLAGAPVDATVVATDVPLEGSAAAVDRLELELVGATLPSDDAGALRVESATFVAELDTDAVRQLMGVIGRIPLTDIELRNGVVRLSAVGFPLVDATAAVEGDRVVFRPAAPLGALITVGVEIGDLPFGFEPEEVEVRDDVLRLRGSASDLELRG